MIKFIYITNKIILSVIYILSEEIPVTFFNSLELFERFSSLVISFVIVTGKVL